MNDLNERPHTMWWVVCLSSPMSELAPSTLFHLKNVSARLPCPFRISNQQIAIVVSWGGSIFFGVYSLQVFVHCGCWSAPGFACEFLQYFFVRSHLSYNILQIFIVYKLPR